MKMIFTIYENLSDLIGGIRSSDDDHPLEKHLKYFMGTRNKFFELLKQN